MLLTTIALAQAGAYEGDLRFSRLDRERGAISYQIEARSYRALQVHGVTPTMLVWQDGELLWSEPLDSWSGTVRPPQGMNRRTVEIAVVGYAGSWHVRSIDGRASVLLEPATRGHHRRPQVDPYPRPREDRSERMAAALEACDDALWDDSLQLRCAQAAVELGCEPGPVVEACDDAFWDDSSVLSCVEAASSSPGDPVAVIEACDESFWDESQALECVGWGARG